MKTIKEIAVIHVKLRRKYGTAPECVFCDEPTYRFEWANVTGDYTDDIDDYLPMCQRHHRSLDNSTDSARRNFSRAQMGNRNGIISVICNMGDGIKVEFESAADASRITGINRTSIVRCFSGRNKTAGGYTWKKGILL